MMAGNLGQILLVMEAEECEKCMHTYSSVGKPGTLHFQWLFIYLFKFSG